MRTLLQLQSLRACLQLLSVYEHTDLQDGSSLLRMSANRYFCYLVYYVVVIRTAVAAVYSPLSQYLSRYAHTSSMLCDTPSAV
jgi:hypothetical protein